MPCTALSTSWPSTPVQALRGRRLEAEDFDRLFSDDPVRDLLAWMSDSGQVKARWDWREVECLPVALPGGFRLRPGAGR